MDGEHTIKTGSATEALCTRLEDAAKTLESQRWDLTSEQKRSVGAVLSTAARQRSSGVGLPLSCVIHYTKGLLLFWDRCCSDTLQPPAHKLGYTPHDELAALLETEGDPSAIAGETIQETLKAHIRFSNAYGLLFPLFLAQINKGPPGHLELYTLISSYADAEIKKPIEGYTFSTNRTGTI